MRAAWALLGAALIAAMPLLALSQAPGPDLCWAPATGAVGYVVRVAEPGGAALELAVLEPRVTLPDDFSPGSTVRVQGFGDVGQVGEWSAPITRGERGWPRPADLTGDGIVGSPDWLLLWPRLWSSDPSADLTGDGVVGVPDFLALVNAWGERGC